MKKLVAFLVIVGLLAGMVGLAAITALLSSASFTTQSNDSLDPCVVFEGGDTALDGIDATTTDVVNYLTEEAFRRGLGKEAAVIAVMAGLTESGLNVQSDGRAEGESSPSATFRKSPWDWSYGLYRTKMYTHIPEAWAKPGGGEYAKNDPDAIARAKDIAWNLKWQADWFYTKLAGSAEKGTASLADFQWRDGKRYRGKPWVAAQKILRSSKGLENVTGSSEAAQQRDPDYGLNYAQNYNKAVRLVDEAIARGFTAADETGAFELSTLSRPFDVPTDEYRTTFYIPGPDGARIGTSGYPVIPDTKQWTETLEVGEVPPVTVAKWAAPIFEDFLARWQKDDILSSSQSLSRSGNAPKGWAKDARAASPSDDAAGVVLTLPSLKTGVSDSEKTAIRKLLRNMGGVIEWDEGARFRIKRDLKPRDVDAWNVVVQDLGTPPYFLVGDSLGEGVKAMLAREIDDITIDTRVGRKTGAGITRLRKNPAAKKAKTWIVELGTNDGEYPDAMKDWVDRVMGLAGTRQVYWVEPYRNADTSLGATTQNVEVLREAARNYPNLRLVKWADIAATHPEYLDESGYHLTPEGSRAFTDAIRGALTGQGAVGLTSSACDSEGVGDIAAMESVGVASGDFVDDLSYVIPGAGKALTRAAIIMKNPGKACGTNAACKQMCGRLSARIWGHSTSGYCTALKQWQDGASKHPDAQPATIIDPVTGKTMRNPEAFQVPIGALMYFEAGSPYYSECVGGMTTTGHVATYVGDGMVVSNAKVNGRDWVYKVPVETVSYNGYLGWAPPAFKTSKISLV